MKEYAEDRLVKSYQFEEPKTFKDLDFGTFLRDGKLIAEASVEIDDHEMLVRWDESRDDYSITCHGVYRHCSSQNCDEEYIEEIMEFIQRG